MVGFLVPAPSQGQIIPDGSLDPERSIVMPGAIVGGAEAERIEGGAIRGSSLFHSFSEFHVNPGQRVYFANPAGIQTIFSRVTGSQRSEIEGTLGVDGGANLWLLNPNGLGFGASSRLDLTGSFLGTTAEAVIFDSYQFSATQPDRPPLLHLNIPLGLQMGSEPVLDVDSGTIVIQSRAIPQPQQILQELNDAGDLLTTAQVIDSNINTIATTISGNIVNLQDVDLYRIFLPKGTNFSANTISPRTAFDTTLFLFDSTGKGLIGNENISELIIQAALPRLVIPEDGFYYLAVTNFNNRPVSAGGEIFNSTFIDLEPREVGANLPLQQWNDRLLSTPVTGNYELNFDILPPNDPGGLQVLPGQHLTLVGREIRLEGGQILAPGATVQLGGLSTGTLNLAPNGQVQFPLEFISENPLGNIILTDNALINVQGNGGGTIEMQGRSLFMDQRSSLLAGISTFSAEDDRAGDILLQMEEDVILTEESRIANNKIGFLGDAGNVRIDTKRLTVDQGSLLSSSFSVGLGEGSFIDVNARESIRIQGEGSLGFGSGIFSGVGFGGQGNSQGIILSTGRLNLSDGAIIGTNTYGAGDAGKIMITATESLVLAGGNSRGLPSIIISEVGNNVAPVEIAAANFVSEQNLGEVIGNSLGIDIKTGILNLSDQSRISASTRAVGNAGNITIAADSFNLNDRSSISTNATRTGNAGDIQIQVRDLFQLKDQSAVSANTSSDSGNITIQTNRMILQNQSTITTNATEDSRGGDITIATDFLIGLPLENNDITANARSGSGGNINISAAGILGFTIRSRANLIDILQTTDPDQLSPRRLATNDVTAFSQANPDLDLGAVQFLTPEVDPTAAIVELSQTFQDASQMLSDRCVVAGQNRFIATGRTPLVPSPTDLPNPMVLLNDRPQDSATPAQLSGTTFFQRGQFRKALTTWEQELDLYRQNQDTRGEYRTRLNQTQALQALGLQDQALDQLRLLQESLAPDSLTQAVALLHWGNALRLTGDLVASQEALSTSLAVAETLDLPPLVAAIFLSLGHTARAQQQFPQALAYYRQSASLPTTANPTIADLTLSPHLTAVQAHLSYLDLWLSLTIAQNDRSTRRTGVDLDLSKLQPIDLSPLIEQAKTLPPDHFSGYSQIHLAHLLLQIHKRRDTLPSLAALSSVNPAAILDLLQVVEIKAQTHSDALLLTYSLGYQGQTYEQMQDWNLAQILTEQALQVAQQIESPEALYSWGWQLGRVLHHQGKNAEAIVAYRQSIAVLRDIRSELTATRTDLQFSFRDRVEPVYRELVSLLLPTESASPAHLQEARSLIEALQLAEVNDYFQDDCATAKPIAVEEVDPTAAVIYPIILNDRLVVIVSIAGQPLTYHTVPVPSAEVNAQVDQLLRSLTTPLRSAQPATQKGLNRVYQWLVAAVEPQLQAAQIETLVFVVDGSLRTLPLAALHDGSQYLIERYNVVLSPGLELLDPRPLPRHNPRLLAGGLSEARHGFAPLPFVEEEIQHIGRLIPDRQLYLNETLQPTRLDQSLSRNPATLIHLATHGEFGSRGEDTFILTWDGRLNIEDFSTLLNQHSSDTTPVELLVLSACKTATGDSRSVLGIAGTAMRANARSVIAGLWALNDQATATFMPEFYRSLLQSNRSKSQAFREAQLHLLRDPRFQAPFYWSSYVLVGNWL